MKVPWLGAFEDVDARALVEDFEDVTELAGILSDRGKLTALRTVLKSRVRPVLDAARRGAENMERAAAKDALIAGFDTPDDCRKALWSFQMAQLEVEADPLSHAVALRALLDRALPILNAAVRSELLLERVVESLPDNLREEVRIA
ncbi:unnamed protein product [Echinostoma caproni]|uniref:DUF2379 domain-containing protein n=1 Tax=Echinostoma caproni TaxID=27848 RepID=A0A183AAN1_9TREM|nr:unnamed protein product [Echinostoma caproni]